MAFLKDYIEIADNIDVFDNSGNVPYEVFSKTQGKATITANRSEHAWIVDYILSLDLKIPITTETD